MASWRFKAEQCVPPGGKYFYVAAETGVYLEAFTKDELLRKLEDHYTANQFPIPADLWSLVLDHMCPRLPEGFCESLTTTQPVGIKVVSLITVRAATEGLVQASKGLAPPQVAEKQADICVKCAANKAVSCPSCSGLSFFARKQTGGRHVNAEAGLGICAGLGAYLPVIVHCIAEKIKGTRWAKEPRPSSCWIGKE